MELTKNTKERTQIADLGKTLQVTIPARKHILESLFLAFWLCGWLMGEVAVLRSLFLGGTFIGGEISLFLLVWLTFWTLGGVQVISRILWNLTGREIIAFSGDRVEVAWRMFGFSKTRDYQLAGVKNIRIHSGARRYFTGQRRLLYFGPRLDRGMVKFDYGQDKIQFAEGISQTEATRIINLLKEKSSNLQGL